MHSICSIDIALIVSQLNKILTEEIKKENKKQNMANLHPTQAKTLFLLRENENLKLSDLASHLSLTKPTVTVVVQKLEEKDYIVRKDCPQDKRCSRIKLTDLGEQVLDDFLEVGNKIKQQLFTGLTEEEIKNCAHTLKKMIDNY